MGKPGVLRRFGKLGGLTPNGEHIIGRICSNTP